MTYIKIWKSWTRHEAKIVILYQIEKTTKVTTCKGQVAKSPQFYIPLIEVKGNQIYLTSKIELQSK